MQVSEFLKFGFRAKLYAKITTVADTEKQWEDTGISTLPPSHHEKPDKGALT